MLTNRGEHNYGDGQPDIPAEIRSYSELNGYPATHFADAKCPCGHNTFRVAIDDVEGAATRQCANCAAVHAIGDSAEYLGEADPGECACPCGVEELEVTVGVSLYEGSEDVRWIYLGCRCPKCHLTAVYGDWKNEFIGYRELLAKV